MLRSGVARCNGAGIQPILLRSTACPYSTFTGSPFAIRPKLTDSSAPSSSCSRSTVTDRKAPTLVIRQTSSRRHASTVSSNPNDQDAAAAAAAAAKQQAAHPNEPPLDWNTFFALRKSRRRWQLTFSIATSAVGGTAGALFLSTGSADWAVNQIPLDPLVTLGLMTFGFAALGWLVGPAIGSQIFYILNRKYRSQMALVSLSDLPAIHRKKYADDSTHRRRANSSLALRSTVWIRPALRLVTRVSVSHALNSQVRSVNQFQYPISTARRSPAWPATASG